MTGRKEAVAEYIETQRCRQVEQVAASAGVRAAEVGSRSEGTERSACRCSAGRWQACCSVRRQQAQAVAGEKAAGKPQTEAGSSRQAGVVAQVISV